MWPRYLDIAKLDRVSIYIRLNAVTYQHVSRPPPPFPRAAMADSERIQRVVYIETGMVFIDLKSIFSPCGSMFVSSYSAHASCYYPALVVRALNILRDSCDRK